MDEAKNIMRTMVRSQQISSCVFGPDDFKNLYSVLSEKAKEAARLTEQEFDEKAHTLSEQDRSFVKEKIPDARKLVAYVTGTKGERVIYTEESGISSSSMPDDVQTIGIGSAYAHKVIFNADPANRFEVRLDFSKPKLLDFTNPWSAPGVGMNYVQVEGNNDTWVNGVFESIKSFFESRVNRRSWLHARHTYDLFLWLLSIPAILWILLRLDLAIRASWILLSYVFLIGIYLYVVLSGLFLFRLLFNYARWVFPQYEYRTQGGTRPGKHRTILWAILLSLGVALAIDVIRYFLKHII